VGLETFAYQTAKVFHIDLIGIIPKGFAMFPYHVEDHSQTININVLGGSKGLGIVVGMFFTNDISH
jgi:hypothetical protein